MGFRTIASMAALVAVGVIVKFILPFLFKVLTLPGQTLVSPDRFGKCSHGRLIRGTVVTAVLESLAYLPYAVFVTCWAIYAMREQGVKFYILLASFFAAIFPVGSLLREFRKQQLDMERSYRKELDEFSQNRANAVERTLWMAVRASSTAFIATVTVFATLVLNPMAAEVLYKKIFCF